MILKIRVFNLIVVESMKLLNSIFANHSFDELIYCWKYLSFVESVILFIVFLFNLLFFSLQICRLCMSKASIDKVLLKIINDLFFLLFLATIKLEQVSSKVNSSHIFIISSKLIWVFLNQVFCLFRHFMLLSFQGVEDS